LVNQWSEKGLGGKGHSTTARTKPRKHQPWVRKGRGKKRRGPRCPTRGKQTPCAKRKQRGEIKTRRGHRSRRRAENELGGTENISEPVKKWVGESGGEVPPSPWKEQKETVYGGESRSIEGKNQFLASKIKKGLQRPK